MTRICLSKLTIIGSDNGILLIGSLGIKFSEIVKIHTLAFKKIKFESAVWKMASILSPPQCVKCVCCVNGSVCCVAWRSYRLRWECKVVIQYLTRIMSRICHNGNSISAFATPRKLTWWARQSRLNNTDLCEWCRQIDELWPCVYRSVADVHN